MCLEPRRRRNWFRNDGKPLGKGFPNQIVKAATWDNWIDEDDEDIRVIDLGETFLLVAEPNIIAQPGQLRAPETIFTNQFDYRIDLWRAGIMVGVSVKNFPISNPNNSLGRFTRFCSEVFRFNTLDTMMFWLPKC